VGSVRQSRRYVAGSNENDRTIKALGAEGTERSRAHSAHNHPSGVLEPSAADELITRRLKEALALIDVRVLDHFIVGDGQCFSFCEHGLI